RQRGLELRDAQAERGRALSAGRLAQAVEPAGVLIDAADDPLDEVTVQVQRREDRGPLEAARLAGPQHPRPRGPVGGELEVEQQLLPLLLDAREAVEGAAEGAAGRRPRGLPPPHETLDAGAAVVQAR